MSGTGRPTYKTRKGHLDPSESYIKTTHLMVRDINGHNKIKLREKKDFSKEILLEKLSKTNFPTIELNQSDESNEESDSSNSNSTNSIDSSEDDYQKTLLNELERMKKERFIEEERKNKEKLEIEREKLNQNPLLINDNYSMNLKWTEETVFQNQSIYEQEKNQKYVNDPVRNPYHLQFLEKYIKT